MSLRALVICLLLISIGVVTVLTPPCHDIDRPIPQAPIKPKWWKPKNYFAFMDPSR